MAHGRETGSGQPALRQALQARGPDLDLIHGLVWGFFCQPLLFRFLDFIWFGLIATTGRTWWGQLRRSEGSPPTGAASRHELVCGRSKRTRTMMQSCASAAKLQGGGPSLPCGIESHVRGRVTTPSVRRRPPTAATLVRAETIGSCLPQAAGRSTTPSSGSPLLTKRQSAINSLRARATIMVLRVAPRASAVRARYQRVSALFG